MGEFSKGVHEFPGDMGDFLKGMSELPPERVSEFPEDSPSHVRSPNLNLALKAAIVIAQVLFCLSVILC